MFHNLLDLGANALNPIPGDVSGHPILGGGYTFWYTPNKNFNKIRTKEAKALKFGGNIAQPIRNLDSLSKFGYYGQFLQNIC